VNARLRLDDGWGLRAEEDTEQEVLRTTVQADASRSVIARNDSPDIPFDRSVNPYRGCEHGCSYCYARPTHAWLDLSPGLDFETRLFARPNAAELLRQELAAPEYRSRPVALGTNTDPYQPIERDYRITRALLEVLEECRHPVTIVTKSRLVLRDLDILGRMAERNLVQVSISVTTLDAGLARSLEPRASTPVKRLEALQRLSEAGIPAGLMFAPVIPAVNDAEMEQVLASAAQAGVTSAGYVMLRLPHEVKELFREWLALHLPLKKDHVMSMINDIRGGRDNDPEFHSRMRGTGVYAAMIQKRFHHACKQHGLNGKPVSLNCDIFQQPVLPGTQQTLF